jgi:phage head maturation protease
MTQTIHEPLTVKTIYDHKKHLVYPAELLWNNLSYKVKKIGLHYMFRIGTTLYHIFTVDTDVLSFKLQLNTDNLFWTVEEISDGLPD